ncbi:NADPH-dependent FMN reductase [Paenibacillus macquariensis]|uniref:NAD(P)H-dependent FMN reductase n=1 Tax=Paenibacillus macquariensis TaxID=948756 RepID=A0ABY1JNE9_9BACL|nr:NADPH-dependent FMN reductase [Paenibacillus macquariensis]MEC0092175.1 NAD(P)H-dependent oxidoreductase [Paenibacillus macquariensis]OAB37274.1 NADPH-dependent FMN reductase [Paenibacillus macquariensis subsp. macquariensis]SIQ49672.1 NAD(P)H-dependent FMN reductase [Paenibacillus macquariensis]
MKIVAIVGSNRKNSFNMKLAQYMQRTYEGKLDIEILPITDLPFYNQEIELMPSETVQKFIGKVAQADAVLWVTPEYNYSIPGILKNAIDWLSRVDKVMVGKPSFIMGASMGALGTVRAQEHLRGILFSPGISSPLLPRNEVYIGAVHEKFDDAGQLVHEPTVAFLNIIVTNFISWYDQHTGAFVAKS